MPPARNFLLEMPETGVMGRRTRERTVGVTNELRRLGLRFVGLTDARAPYRAFRHCNPDGHLIATLAGEGEIWFRGRWRRCREGDVFFNPPARPEAFRAVSGIVWRFCWVHTFPSFFAAFPQAEAVWFEADVRLLHLAIEGLLCAAHAGRPLPLGPWAALVRNTALDLLGGLASGRRLQRLWAEVSREPGHAWTIGELGRRAGLSREQLRFHSRRETGRAPMEQVAHLRMERATDILRTSNLKLDAVADLLGYSTAYAFSNSFHRVTGRRPSELRPRK